MGRISQRVGVFAIGYPLPPPRIFFHFIIYVVAAVMIRKHYTGPWIFFVSKRTKMVCIENAEEKNVERKNIEKKRSKNESRRKNWRKINIEK